MDGKLRVSNLPDIELAFELDWLRPAGPCMLPDCLTTNETTPASTTFHAFDKRATVSAIRLGAVRDIRDCLNFEHSIESYLVNQLLVELCRHWIERSASDWIQAF